MMGHVRALVVVTTTMAAGLWLGALTVRAAGAQARDPYRGLEMIAQALVVVETQHPAPPPRDALIHGALAGIAEATDRWTSFLQPDAYADRRSAAETPQYTVGLRLVDEGGAVRVLEVIPHTSADQAGLSTGETIVRIDGVAPADAAMAEGALQGERGSVVTVEVGGSAPRAVELTRARLVDRSVWGLALAPGIALVRIEQFRVGAAGELLAVMDGLDASRGLVLDLRANGGGLLEEAIAVTDLFVDAGTIVRVRRRDAADEVHAARERTTRYRGPMVVLVDGVTASAAEVAAGALQALGRARLVGTRTYGKGTIQQAWRFEDGTALWMTTGRYAVGGTTFIPDGEGLAPDVVVERPRAADAHAAALSSGDLSAAQRSALDALVALADDTPEPPRSAADDVQVQAALRALEGG